MVSLNVKANQTTRYLFYSLCWKKTKIRTVMTPSLTRMGGSRNSGSMCSVHLTAYVTVTLLEQSQCPFNETLQQIPS